MQDKSLPESQCHYPDCAAPAVKTCGICHQNFCIQHIHRRWWSYTCEFCLLQRAAGRVQRSEGRLVGRYQLPGYNVTDEVREKNDEEKIDELAD